MYCDTILRNCPKCGHDLLEILIISGITNRRMCLGWCFDCDWENDEGQELERVSDLNRNED